MQTWRSVAELLSDRELLSGSDGTWTTGPSWRLGTATCGRFWLETLDSTPQWLSRALELPLRLSEPERCALRSELAEQGRQAYVARRTLLQGRRVALLGCDQRLVRWCGGTLQRAVAGADLVLLGRRAGRCTGARRTMGVIWTLDH